MEPSVQAYLKRVSTEQLEQFLQDYQKHLHTEDFSGVIGDVIKELKKRKEENGN